MEPISVNGFFRGPKTRSWVCVGLDLMAGPRFSPVHHMDHLSTPPFILRWSIKLSAPEEASLTRKRRENIILSATAWVPRWRYLKVVYSSTTWNPIFYTRLSLLLLLGKPLAILVTW